MLSVAIGVLVFVAIFVALAMAYASRVKKVGPNEALVISGRGEGRRDPEAGEMKSNFRIVTGGRSFIWPVLERIDVLSLEIMTIDITTPDVPSSQGVPVTVDGVAQVKIGSDENSIRTAAIQFLSKSGEEIRHIAHETLAGHLRAILGTLTVEQLYRDREAFAQKVQEVSGDDMASMGLEIVSFVIKDISDEEGYLEALGRPRIAQVKRDAAIGEAEAERDATIESARARQEGESAKFVAETKIAESRKDFEVEQAAFQAQSNRQKAESDLAYTLQENVTNQDVQAEAIQVEIVRKQKQIEVQHQETLRMEQELDATVRKPAEAERFRIQTLAEARQQQLKIEALGEAEAIRLRGEAEADAARALGIAEAEVIRQKGLAEAEASREKAEAWKQYSEAAILQQLLDRLPEVASAVAQPLSNTDRIVVISNGENGSGTGAAKVSRDVTDIVSQVPATIEALTGFNLMEALGNLAGLQPPAGVNSPEVQPENGQTVSSEQPE